ncbi:MAG: hypothetical protein V2I74_05045 [Erythrobacter sp.]|jgi:hypothetical protein|nr:hypothetical protein [Erythrobacter sp.]
MSNPTVPRIFDKHRRALRYRRARALHRQGRATTWLDDDMVEDILERVDFMQLPEGRAYITGELTNNLAPELIRRGIEARESGPDRFDEERPWEDPSCNYIFSIRTLSTLNDLPGALLHMRNALPQGGLYFAQMLGAGSLPALRRIMLAADGDAPAARIHPQIDNRSASALLQRAGFARQVVDSRTLTVRFSSFERMIADLRELALTSILADRAPPLTRASLSRARAAFDAMRDRDGKVPETFEILALTAWR